jgi:hypothetical protein
VYYWCTRTDETAWEPPSEPSPAPLDNHVVAFEDSSGSSNAFTAQSLVVFNTTTSSVAYQMVEGEDSVSSGAFEESAVGLPDDWDNDADNGLPESESELDGVGKEHGNPFAPASLFFRPTSTAQRYPVHPNRMQQSTLIPLAVHIGVDHSDPAKEHSRRMNPFSAAGEMPCDTSEADSRCSITVSASANGDHGEAPAEVASADSGLDCDDEIDCEDEDDLSDDDGGDEGGERQTQAQECGSEPVWTQCCANSLEVSSAEGTASMLRVFGTVVRGAGRTERQYPRSGIDDDDWELPKDLEPASCAMRMDFEAGATLSLEQQRELARRAKKLRDVQHEIAALRAELGISRG